ncbi:MAG: hypothetical protein ACKO3H_09215 [Verrucomicrobiota bacterium]
MKTLKLVIAWLLVGVPLAWGVIQSIEKSLPLFRGAPTTATPMPSGR